MSDTNQLPTPPAERPTPITDAATFVIPCHGADGTGSRVAVVHFQVASDLERQLSEVRESGQRKVTEMAHRIAQLEYDLKQVCEQRNRLAASIRSFLTDFEQISWGWNEDCGSRSLVDRLFDEMAETMKGAINEPR